MDILQPTQPKVVPSRNFGFEPFAREEFYRGVNLELVKMLIGLVETGLGGKTVMDVACGDGLMTKLLLDRSQPEERPARVICVDASPDALKAAEAELSPFSNQTRFYFVEADAQQGLPRDAGLMDVVLFGNAIHLMVDKDAAIRHAAQVTRQGGYFVVNTTFYDGFAVPGTEHLWVGWIKEAMLLKKKWPFERGKSNTKLEFLTSQQYSDLLVWNGFKLGSSKEDEVRLGQSALEAIAEYPEFVQGALRPLAEYLSNASRALKEAVANMFQKYQINSIPRNWLQIVAQKV